MVKNLQEKKLVSDALKSHLIGQGRLTSYLIGQGRFDVLSY